MIDAEAYHARDFDQRVKVQNHDYVFEGYIIAAFTKRDNISVRCVVENDDKVCLIQSPKNLVRT